MVIAVANRAKDNKSRDRSTSELLIQQRLPHGNDEKINTLEVSDWLRIGIILKEIAGVFHLNTSRRTDQRTVDGELLIDLPNGQNRQLTTKQ